MQKTTLQPGKKRKRTAHVRRYDGIAELVKAVPDSHYQMITTQCDPKDIGRLFLKPDDIKKAAKETDQRALQTIERFKTMLAEKLPEPKIVKRVRRWDETDGDTFDNDRFRNGQQAWCRMTREKFDGTKSITLAVSIGGNISVAASDLMWAPSLAIALADMLETAGYSVKLVAGIYSGMAYTNDRDTMTMVTVKDAGKPVDTSTAATFASGWFFRAVTIGDFRNSTNEAGAQVTENYGMGMPTLSGHCEPDEIDGDLNAAELFEIPMIHNLESALTYGRHILKKIDGE